MGLTHWLLEPIREVKALEPKEASGSAYRLAKPRRGRSRSEDATDIGEDTFEKLENQRRAALRFRLRTRLVGAAAVPILAVATYFILSAWGAVQGDSVLWGTVVLILGALLVRSIAEEGVAIFRESAKKRVLSVLAAQQGLDYQMENLEKEARRPFKEQQLFGAGNSTKKTEDIFSGTLEGVGFLLFEARVNYRSSSGDSTKPSNSSLAFHGLCLSLSFPKRFSGTTRVLSDWGGFNKMYEWSPDLKLERARLEDAEFEKHFEVVTTDQVEARYLLTPALMERLLQVQRLLGENTRLRAGFHGHYMLLTLDTQKNRPFWTRLPGVDLNENYHFEIKNPKRPVVQMELVQQFKEEIALFREIVRTLKLNMKSRV